MHFPRLGRLALPTNPAQTFAALIAVATMTLAGCGESGSSADAPTDTTNEANAETSTADASGQTSEAEPAEEVAEPTAVGSASDSEKTLRIPMQTNGPESLDPVEGSTTYENRAVAQVYETLLQYKYLVRPFELEPLLLTKMPEISEDGTTWEFELRDDVYFHDSECFPNGEGRKLRSEDVFYSWKRLADPDFRDENWWLIKDVIKGFDEFKAEQTIAVDAGGEFDYDAPVEGFEVVDDRRFRVILNKPDYQFKWKLAMFQLSVVPREAVEHFGEAFAGNPVGTGPFILRDPDDWERNQRIVFYRNPEYREAYFPSEARNDDDPLMAARFQEIADAAKGQRLPIVDKMEFTFFVEDNPMWLSFKAGDKDYTTTPDFGYEEAFDVTTGKLKRSWEFDGIVPVQVPLLDFIFRGFNMEDDMVGGYTPERIALRQAIHACIDYDELNKAYYNGLCKIFDGPIPPGMAGYPANDLIDGVVHGPDYDLARAKLIEAGYNIGDDGKVTDLPPIDFYTSSGATNQKHTELIQRHLSVVGIDLNPRLVDFTTLIQAVNNKKAPMFSFAWGSDYPDAENNLALFFSENKAPGSNHYNYDRPEFDELYRQSKLMDDGPERTALYEQMRDMVIADQAYSGSLARTRTYLIHPWVKNFYPTETFFSFKKYIDIDIEEQPEG